MGNGGSKPVGDPSSHVFSADTPVQFSQQVLDSLQSSSETDSVRARAKELHIQARVQAELAKIRDAEGERLQSLLSELTPAEAGQEADDPSLASRAASALGGKGGVERTHDTVKKEVESLRAKLDGRRKLEKPAAEVQKAKDELVQCLRVNDRRPLDCWKEVEIFKQEVAKMEKGFVERTMR